MMLGLAALLTMAAAPQQNGFSLATPAPTFTVKPENLGKAETPSGFAPAPLPNRDAVRPVTRQSSDPSLAPGIFTRKDQYHGEGLAPSDSAQIEQERRVKPGAGLNLTMPLQ